MKIMKFGGSSLATAERIISVANIVLENNKAGRVAAVLSAMKGTTDLLIKSATQAETGDRGFKKSYQEIEKLHDTAIKGLIPTGDDTEVRKLITGMLKEIKDILHGIELVRECSIRSMDLIMSFGERLSCTLMAGYLHSIGIEAEMVDSREILKTDSQFGNAAVQFTESYEKINKRISEIKGIPIITGFIGSDSNNITTTLGRNGSDYSASIMGAGINAECIEIWTDVDGVMSCDPRAVETAFVVPEISYEEAMELSYFGAKVIHPYTMIPAVDKNIPIWIKNTLNPSTKGTLIAKDITRHQASITGIACIEDVSVINVEGGGIMKNPFIPARIFTALAEGSINTIMISQASSEHSVCLVLKEKDAEKAMEALKKILDQEIRDKRIESLNMQKDLLVVAIIGENMRGTPGISGKLFSALGEKKINVFAIAQGSSERNISFVTDIKMKDLALNTVHKAFLE